MSSVEPYLKERGSLDAQEPYFVKFRRIDATNFHAQSVDFPDLALTTNSVQHAISHFTDLIEDRTWTESRTHEYTTPKAEADCGSIEQNCFLIPISIFKKHRHFPEIVYQYKRFEAYVPRMLAEPYIWFSRTSDFNDPFEGTNIFNDEYTDLDRMEDFLNMGREYCENRGEVFNLSEYRQMYYRLLIEDGAAAKNFTDDVLRKKIYSLNKASSSFVITCFSRLYDSTLMWSHYADKHRGLVIGFDSDVLNKLEPSLASDVEYRKTKPLVSPGRIPFSKAAGNAPETEAYVLNVLRTRYLIKHSFWRYEQEIRLITQGDVGPVKLPVDSIKEVYFGLNMDRALRTMLISFLKGRSVRLFDMVFADHNELTRTEIIPA